jgi:hypothetical protein
MVGLFAKYFLGFTKKRRERMKHNVMFSLVASLLLVPLLLTGTVLAQSDDEPALSLRLNRDFGYGLGSQMQGRFSYRVRGPDDLARVEFLLDGQVIGEDTEAPFRLNFQTGNYDLGQHTMSAIGYTAAGGELHSNSITREFVAGNSVIWIVLVVVGLAIGFQVFRFFFTRQRSGSKGGQQGYGYLGGTVCPNCGRPYSIHWWSLRLIGNRLDRCPHCGKIAVIQRAPADKLNAAETFEWELDGEDTKPTVKGLSDEERERRHLEESRYEDR